MSESAKSSVDVEEILDSAMRIVKRQLNNTERKRKLTMQDMDRLNTCMATIRTVAVQREKLQKDKEKDLNEAELEKKVRQLMEKKRAAKGAVASEHSNGPNAQERIDDEGTS